MNKTEYTKLVKKLGSKFKQELNEETLTKEKAEEYLAYPENDVINFTIPVTVKDFKSLTMGDK